MEIKSEDGIAKSHEAHEVHMKNLIGEKDARLFHIKNQDCVLYKVNVRTLLILEPFWSKPNTWLTIADYNGLEANFLANKSQKVLASDISDVFLADAKSEGLIENYQKINVEHIDYPDNSFDYVSCREAFHHFPRAYLGLYEMMRVSKKAAIIIEPIDILTKMPLLLLVKNILDRFNPLLINKLWKNRFSFEKVGNYVFKISEREIEKMAMGIGLRLIAFKGINILTNCKENSIVVPHDRKLLREIQQKFRFQDFLCRTRIIPYNNICCVIFKEYPDAFTVRKMREQGYKIIELPANPYL